MIKLFKNYAKIDTCSTTLLLQNVNGVVYKVYYGNHIKDDDDYVAIFNYHQIDTFTSSDDTSYSNLMMSSPGDGANVENMIRVTSNKGVFLTRFICRGFSICDINTPYSNFPHSMDKLQTLKITYQDIVNNLELNQYISIFDNSDVISFSNELINLGHSEVKVNRLLSCQLDFEASEVSLHSLDGAWCRERNHNVRVVKNNKATIESRSGFSSNLHNPFVILEVPNQGIVASNLVYSGNHLEIVESVPVGRCRFLTGMNDYMMNYSLRPTEKLSTPEAVVCFGNNLDEITFRMHHFVRNHIIRKEFRNKERPVLLNNWEATYFDFTHEKLVKLAEVASSVGIELFVLDDGWFGKRNTDNCSLGDWVDNTQKTGGLDKLSKKIKDMGLKFGLWFEPEMISFDSDLYRAHPEYMMRVPNVEPMEKRNQEMLDLANPEVVDYLVNALSDVFSKVQPDYVKWDCNRNMIDVYSSVLENQGEYFIRYIRGLYDLCYRLVMKFPNILFEACSAGGNRFDLGMLYFMPQTWASDNSEASCRLLIQEGTLFAYPQNTMGAHVSIVPNHQTLFSSSIENRFNVASIGAFGYELDLEALSKEDLDSMKKQIVFYKENRKLLQNGIYYRLESLTENNSGGWIVINEDQSEAIATIVVKKMTYNWVRPKFKFKGLNKDYRYMVTMREQTNLKNNVSFVANGDVLMNYGVDFGDLFFTETDRYLHGNSFASRMILIKKVD